MVRKKTTVVFWERCKGMHCSCTLNILSIKCIFVKAIIETRDFIFTHVDVESCVLLLLTIASYHHVTSYAASNHLNMFGLFSFFIFCHWH